MKALAKEISNEHDLTEIDFTPFLKRIGISYQQWFDWYTGKHTARESTAKRIRAKLAKLNQVDPAPGFSSSKVSEGVVKKAENDSMTMKLVSIIVQEWERGGVADVDTLESLRYLLSK